MWASHGLDRFCVRPYLKLGPELQVTVSLSGRLLLCQLTTTENENRLCMGIVMCSSRLHCYWHIGRELHGSQVLYLKKSLIIHEEKTKEINV